MFTSCMYQQDAQSVLVLGKEALSCVPFKWFTCLQVLDACSLDVEHVVIVVDFRVLRNIRKRLTLLAITD